MLALVHGKIYNEGAFKEALVTDNGKIKYVGDSRTAINMLSDKDQIINLEGRLVVPGFIDSHAHGGYFGVEGENEISLKGIKNVEDCLEYLKEFKKNNPKQVFYKGYGWPAVMFDENGPEKELLDEIFPDTPCAIKSIEGHAYWINSKLLEIAGIDKNTPSPRGGCIFRNDDGTPKGCLADSAINLVVDYIPDNSIEEYEIAIKKYQKEMVSLGITSYGELMVRKGGNLHQAYIKMAEQNELIIKSVMHYHVRPETIEEDIANLSDAERIITGSLVDGHFVKLFADGVLENHTAALKEEYDDIMGFKGELLWEDDKISDVCRKLSEKGYNIHIHCIGDEAVRQAVDALGAIANDNCKTVIAHIQLADQADIVRMAEKGIMFSSNPYWYFRDELYTAQTEIPTLGDRANIQYPMESFFKRDIIVSCGSDYPITIHPYPIVAIKYGMYRIYESMPEDDLTSLLAPKERASFEDMFKCITINGALTLGIDDITGSIEVGKAADLVVLDRDIFNGNTEGLQNVQVDMTFSDGKMVYMR